QAQGGGLAAATRAEQREELAAGHLEGGAVDRGHAPEELLHAVEAQHRLAGHAGAPCYLITALAMSWVLMTSGRFSSASTWSSFAPRGTTRAGLPGSTPRRRLFVSISLAHWTWASLVRSQLTKSLAAAGW